MGLVRNRGWSRLFHQRFRPSFRSISPHATRATRAIRGRGIRRNNHLGPWVWTSSPWLTSPGRAGFLVFRFHILVGLRSSQMCL